MTITSPFRMHRQAYPLDAPLLPAGHRTEPEDEPDEPDVEPVVQPLTAPAPEPAPEPDEVDEPIELPTEIRPAASLPATSVRLGSVSLRTAAPYLCLWTLVLLVVEVLVFWLGYAALARLGVLESLSSTAATVLGEQVPESGVLPALQLEALLPWAVAAGAGIAVLCLITSLALVVMHNCICALTGGPGVRVRLPRT